MIETFFKSLKSEMIWRTVFQKRDDAQKAIDQYIDGFLLSYKAAFLTRLYEPSSVRENDSITQNASPLLRTKSTHAALGVTRRSNMVHKYQLELYETDRLKTEDSPGFDTYLVGFKKYAKAAIVVAIERPNPMISLEPSQATASLKKSTASTATTTLTR